MARNGARAIDGLRTAAEDAFLGDNALVPPFAWLMISLAVISVGLLGYLHLADRRRRTPLDSSRGHEPGRNDWPEDAPPWEGNITGGMVG